MSRPRFLTDNDFNAYIVSGVLRREPTVEFLSVRDIGMHDRPDPEILAHAAGEGLIVVTHDVNTMTGHAYDRIRTGQPMAGLFAVRQEEPIGPVIESLVLVSVASEAEEWAQRVTFLPL